MLIVVALVSGILFGAGLVVSRMTDPQKILNFLDLAAIRTGGWDPSLLMVFAGALSVMFVAYRIRARTERPLVGVAYSIPTRTEIDLRLVGGAAIFGVGWGLAGLCPGPAMTALAIAGPALGQTVIFVLALLAGVGVAMALRTRNARST